MTEFSAIVEPAYSLQSLALLSVFLPRRRDMVHAKGGKVCFPLANLARGRAKSRERRDDIGAGDAGKSSFANSYLFALQMPELTQHFRR